MLISKEGETMAANEAFAHLPLPLLYRGTPKLHGGGAVSAQTRRNTANRIAHGGYIKRRSAELSRFWKERIALFALHPSAPA